MSDPGGIGGYAWHSRCPDEPEKTTDAGHFRDIDSGKMGAAAVPASSLAGVFLNNRKKP